MLRERKSGQEERGIPERAARGYAAKASWQDFTEDPQAGAAGTGAPASRRGRVQGSALVGLGKAQRNAPVLQHSYR